MQISVKQLLEDARSGGYAIGAFNVYNLEGILAVIAASESERSPVILQLHPSSLRNGGPPLVGACLTAVRKTDVPAAVHLDHSTEANEISAALTSGIESVMADGSNLDFIDNVEFTRRMTTLAHAAGACVEGELGRLSGKEDGSVLTEREAKMTDPSEAARFVAATGVDTLAVCIGNVHGPYTSEPHLDFMRLEAIRGRVKVPLVLHGGSGLSEALISRSISLGISKLNVNTELRAAYLKSLRELAQRGSLDLLEVIQSAIVAMKGVVAEKLRVFGSVGKAGGGTFAQPT